MISNIRQGDVVQQPIHASGASHRFNRRVGSKLSWRGSSWSPHAAGSQLLARRGACRWGPRVRVLSVEGHTFLGLLAGAGAALLGTLERVDDLLRRHSRELPVFGFLTSAPRFFRLANSDACGLSGDHRLFRRRAAAAAEGSRAAEDGGSLRALPADVARATPRAWFGGAPPSGTAAE